LGNTTTMPEPKAVLPIRSLLNGGLHPPPYTNLRIRP
jgi:hypothetical protein